MTVAGSTHSSRSDDTTLFTCTSPPSANAFMRRLRLRERLYFLLIMAACAITLWITAEVKEHLDSRILLTVVLWIGAFGLAVCAIIAVSVRLSVPKRHIFGEDTATLYLNGLFTVRDTVAAKKIQKIQAWPTSYNNADFYLFCVICSHLEQGRNAGVFPVYFCVETADAPEVLAWARARHIHIEGKDRLVSPAKLPLFIK